MIVGLVKAEKQLISGIIGWFLTVFCTFAYADVSVEKLLLGKLIFNDFSLSEPAGRSCGSCHKADAFYADPGKVNSPGVSASLLGKRNTPSISYVKYTPDLYWDEQENHWVGGFFWDGRAKTLAEQAGGPLLNPTEMANKSQDQVIAKIKSSSYKALFEKVYGKTIWENSNEAFAALIDALVAYESGPEFGLFTSKYDYYLQGKASLTAIEKKGLELFEAEDKGNCSACHPSRADGKGERPLFTDFTYDNLGLPSFSGLLSYGDGDNSIDSGLYLNPHIRNAEEGRGKFKVPTLRNVEKTAPYMHNGMLETLEDVMDFYNSRDVDKKWGKPEIPENLNSDELGDLGLSDIEKAAIVAFMKTLTDGYDPSFADKAKADRINHISND